MLLLQIEAYIRLEEILLQVKDQVRSMLTQHLQQNKPLIGVAAGSGSSAKQAIAGGADFLLALNAGQFRSAGVSTLGCLLPFGNSNTTVMSFGLREILPHALHTPVIFGACATDPTIDHQRLLEQIRESGFHGVNNFPSVGLIDGTFRDALEAEGLGFEQEVSFLAEASRQGLFTVAFVFNEEQATLMAQAQVDMICAHLGWTLGGETGVRHSMTLEEGVLLANRIFQAAQNVNPTCFHFVYGGPITSPEDAVIFYKQTSAIGMIGGSSFERLPTESSIKKVTDQFKNYASLEEENLYLKKELQKKLGFDEIVGKSRPMQEIYALVKKVANKNVNVLVHGESGTGKELIVRSLHHNSDRYNQAFVKINCAALPETLLESELFGHEKGAFTGAIQQRLGRFELADKGTLFLDEIGEMSLSTQAKLLRVIQQQEFERVGGSTTIKVDVRIVCATNVNLREAVEQGRFREDLYYRLNVVSIQTVPLRDHKEDIPLLISHFIQRINQKFHCEIQSVTPAALDAMLNYDWPGNVRELENTLERAAILSHSSIIGLSSLPPALQQHIQLHEQTNRAVYAQDVPYTSPQSIESIEKQYILDTLAHCSWNRTKAAEQLGITRRTLYNKLKKYHIQVP